MSGKATGRPKQHGERTGTAIRLPSEMHAELKSAAAERDVSVNWLVNLAVREMLERLIPVEELRFTR